VTINVTAGTPGTPITSKYAGTSYTNPGMTMTTNVALVGNVATSCYPNPSPTLTTTSVS
jgi:dehydratase